MTVLVAAELDLAVVIERQRATIGLDSLDRCHVAIATPSICPER